MKDSTIINNVDDLLPETSMSKKLKELEEVGKAEDPDNNKMISLYEQKSLTFKGQDPNYIYSCVNDIGDEVESHLMAGWQLVKGDIHNTYQGKGRQEGGHQGSYVTRVVNPNTKNPNGVFMRLRRDIWEKRQVHLEQKRQEFEETQIDKNGSLNITRGLGPAANLNRRRDK